MDELGQLLSSSAKKSSSSSSDKERKKDWLEVDDEFVGDEEVSEDEEDYNNYMQHEEEVPDDGEEAYDASEFDSIMIKQEQLEHRVCSSKGRSNNNRKRSSAEEGRLLKENEDVAAVPLKKKKIGLTAMQDYFIIDDGGGGGCANNNGETNDSLVSLCRGIVVANIERYPSNVIGMLDEDNWDEIIQLRHERSKPKSGVGGLDGTGRKKPAMDAKVLLEIEQANPHLAESRKVDELIWKDCVNYRFHPNALSGVRPPAFMYPWPLLIEKLQTAITTLQHYSNPKNIPSNKKEQVEDNPPKVKQEEQPVKQEEEADGPAIKQEESPVKQEDEEEAIKQEPEQQQQEEQEEVMGQLTEAQQVELEQALRTLQNSPMNVTLLKESGVGKSLKKIIKTCTGCAALENHPLNTIQLSIEDTTNCPNNVAKLAKTRTITKQLQKLLDTWMDMAKNNGVKMDTANKQKSSTAMAVNEKKYHQQDLDLRVASKCKTWRKLYSVLKQKEEQKRESQGAKMRMVRKNLARDRPKVVKVRHEMKAKHAKILANQSLTKGRGIAGLSNYDKAESSNLLKVRREASLAAKLAKGKTTVVAGSFSANVAFAQCMKKKDIRGTKKTPPATFVAVAPGRQMKMPVKKQSNLVTSAQQQQQRKQQQRQRLMKKR